MFGGEEERLTLEFDNSLIGVVLDRFGKEFTIFKKHENSFIVHINVFVSPILLGWIFSFGDKVKILSPESLIGKLREMTLGCLSQYELKLTTSELYK